VRLFGLITILFLFGATPTLAQSAATKTTMKSERGFVSLGVNFGASESRAMNPDGSWAASSGLLYGAELEFRIWGEGEGELRLFGRSQHFNEKSRENAANSVQTSTTAFGFKIFATEAFYLGAGVTNNVQKFNTVHNEFSLTNPGMNMGFGYEFHVSGNFFGGVHAWYQSNPLKNESPLSSNSFNEGGLVFLSLSWSPPITIINSTIMGR
jgi:hypothetical protein